MRYIKHIMLLGSERQAAAAAGSCWWCFGYDWMLPASHKTSVSLTTENSDINYHKVASFHLLYCQWKMES